MYAQNSPCRHPLADQPRNAEIEQLHAEPFSHHDIARFDIGMNHQFAVRIFQRIAGIAKQGQPRRQIKVVCLAHSR